MSTSFRRIPRRIRLTLALAAIVLVAAGTPARATFPGENGRIVFDTAWTFFNGLASSQVYSVAPDGSHLRQLTHVEEGTSAWHPAVSPDARQIVYVVSAEGQNDQVWIMRADGSRQRPLLDDPEWNDNAPSFTASGRRVLFSRCGTYVVPYWTCRIVSVRWDGSGMRTVVGGTWHPYDPAMSPDGSRIAYVSDFGGYEGRIWIADVGGGAPRPLDGTMFAERVSWSPDGTQLLFTGYRDGGRYRIAADGTGLRLEVPHSLEAAWSPDGTRIVFKVEDPNDTFGFGPLRITAVDGSDPVDVVDASMGVGYSDWGVAR
jgi:Tol biopolymer transport system component